MDSREIRTALGKLQAEPDADEAWAALTAAAATPDGDLSREDFVRLLEAAQDEHARRGEWQACVRLLEHAVAASQGTPREAELLLLQAKVLGEELYDDDAAGVCYLRLLELRPQDPAALAAIEESDGRRRRMAELKESYLLEVERAGDDVYKSSMLMRASELEARFGGQADIEPAIERLEQAVRLDPTNVRAGRLLEHLYRRRGRWEEVARVLERLADRGERPSERVAAGVRLARLYAQHLSDPERAVRAYDQVLRDDSNNVEAMSFLSERYSNEERWADLVALYERELKSKDLHDAERLGDMLQIAMLHWKKLGRAEDAEPWFERVRKVEPANEIALGFYREFCRTLEDDTRLMDVLHAAQRALKDGSKEKARLAQEIARLADGQANAAKAIEQYKSVLRQDPDNVEARERLKTLYKQTQGHNALVELLRQQLERTPQDKYAERLEILREVATVYRLYQKSDTALLSVLNQIVQLDDKLDEHDVLELREIVQLYEKLGRHRELITHQMKLAEVTPELPEKIELYRAAARRWLEQFSNVQNATEAYAKLLAISPEDREARERLDELYRKRRAWPELYALYSSELERAEGATRLTLLREMAQLAAERLNRSEDAVRLYKEILVAEPDRLDVLDALEKHAERNKDWRTLAEALERRVELVSDEATKLATLQKLGTIYSDHVGDAAAAAKTWRRVLTLSPGHNRALRVLRETYLQNSDYDGLEQLYGSQNDWEGLAEVLSNAADRAKDASARIELSYRTARVLAEQLGQPERAFRAYERILAADPNDTRAARALLPLYEKDEKWSRLPALYELLLEKLDSVEEKLELYGKLVEVTGKRLSDRRSAAAHARRAYELAPTSPVALGLFEETSRAAGTWDVFVEVIAARLAAEPVGAPPPVDSVVAAEKPSAEEKPGGEKKKGKKKKKGPDASQPTAAEPPAPKNDALEGRRVIELMLARVYAEELSRTDDAVATYKVLLERDPLDAEARAQLESILRREDRRDDLRWLLELKIETAADDAEKRRLLIEFAELEEDAFGAPERAVPLYRRVLSVDSADATALRALPRLLLAASDPAAAVAVIEKHRDVLAGEARAEREADLAELYNERLNRPADALESAIAALNSPAAAPRAVAVLEALVRVDSVRARAAEVLAQRYAEGGDARKEVTALEVMLAGTKERTERMSLYRRLADALETKLSSFSSALDTMLLAVREFPNELELWTRADTLSGLAGRPTDLADAYREVLRQSIPSELDVELSERAAHLHEDKLGDPMGAIPYLERVLNLAPANETAFQRLKDILTGAERWSELEALYDRASNAAGDVSRRIEMLVEVALICEEIIEDAAKATRYYERIVEADPFHDGAIRALDRLYVRQGRDRELSALLDKRLETAVGDEAFELKLRLAKLQLDLHEPDKAVAHVEDVLRERVSSYEARGLAERMLEIGTLRVRSARMLEAVYEARDEIRDLVRVLEIRLEGLEGKTPEIEAERRELLRRIANLRDERLHDDEGALEAFARLVPLDPLDAEARARLREIGRRVAAHPKVARVLAQAAEGADTPGLRGEILMDVARIYEELVGDRVEAERVYRQVLEIDRNDAELTLPAARALERIYMQSGDNPRLAEILKVEVSLEESGSTRSGLLGRLGDLCEKELLDNDGAIAAWKQRIDESPEDQEALSALDRLYEKTERFRDLVDVMARRRDITTDPELRRSLLVRTAQTLWRKLESMPEAIDSFQSLLSEFGPDGDTLRSLESLYQSSERWDDLAETYERHIDAAASDAERLELLAKLGDLKREHLSDVTGALEVFRRALSLDSKHPGSRAALEKLLDAPDPNIRREAAQTLRPILEAEGAHEQLLRVIEIDIDTSDDPAEKLTGLERALRVSEGPLGDAARAFGYAERGMRTAVGHTDLTPWFEKLDRLAAHTGRQAEHVKLLCEVVPSIFDGDVQLEITLKIAELARHKLADRELAREYYRKALEIRVDDKQALSALESLYEESGDAQSLLEILERRVDVAESDEERKQLMFRRARLLADVLDDKARAIEVYEAILELGVERAALDALETLYTQVARWPDLVRLYERQLDGKWGAKSDIYVSIARVLARQQGDVERAFDELEQALKLDRQHAGAITELERLLLEAPDAEQRARAAALLEPVYLLRADFTRVMDAIRARLECASDPDDRRTLLTRLAKLYEEQKEDYRAALETVAKLLHEDISDEDSVSELERLAKVAGAEQRLAEIYAAELSAIDVDDQTSTRFAKRAGELFNQLSQPDRSLEFYRRALAFDPENRGYFEAIDGILKKLSRHEERVKLYRESLDHRFEPKERLEALHTIAGLERRELGRPDDAIETYRSALEVDETDTRTLDALTELYRERERNADLSDLYLRRAESASDATKANEFRLALARLQQHLGESDRAVDQLEEIVRVTPNHPEALADLEALRRSEPQRQRVVEILRPLYEAADDWRRLITLNEDRFALAPSEADKVSVLRETAELWERRGGDVRRARRALEAAVRLDPDDADVRSEYQRLTEENAAWEQLARTYEEVLVERPDLVSKREILNVLAEVHNVRRDDPRSALDAYDRLRATDESDIVPLEKMEALATLLSDWPTLVRVLTAKADLIFDDGERASVWRRIGEAKRDMLDDARGAISAYERALELEPDSAFTVDCLIELYESRHDARRLVELYQRRVELADEDDNDLRYELLSSAAKCYEEQLSDRPRAIEALVQALAVRPNAAPVIASLNRLYRAEGMWHELLENLRLEVGLAENASARAGLRKEIAITLAERLERYDEALESYRSALDDAPEDADVVAKVRTLGEQHEDLRHAVADVLVPVLRRTEGWEQLASVLELRLSVEQDPSDRTQTLMAISEILETKLSRAPEALGALLRALQERPDNPQLHRELERLAESTKGFERYAEALTERAGATFDPDTARDLFVRLGRVCEERLNDDRRAVSAYVRALEQAGDQPELLDALDRLYARLGDHGALSDVLERRVVVENSDPQRAQLYYRLSVLQVKEFKEPARALGSLRLALEAAPDHEGAVEELERLTELPDLFEEAAEVLENVYRTRGRTDRLARLYEQRVSFADTPGARVDMRKNLALVLEQESRDPRAALRVIEQGLSEAPDDPGLLDEVERLAAITSEWPSAAAALRKAIEKSPGLLPDVAVSLCIRLAGWLRDRAGDSTGAESALVMALEHDPSNDEVLGLLEQLQKSAGRERDLLETLRRRAKLQIDDRGREALYSQAKDLAIGLGDTALAETVLRELLSQDDANLWALDGLTKLREQAGDYQETFTLLVRQSELGADAGNVKRLRRRAAEIARDKLDSPEKAAELFEQLFEDDPNDHEAADALRALYPRIGRFQELARLIERLIDVATTPSTRSALRLELSELYEKRFQAADTAIEHLRAVLDEEPGQEVAVVRLSELYERTQRDEELAELLSTQIEAARARGDVAAELAFQVRLGEICESRLGDRGRAIDTYRGVLARDARHRGALDALARLLRADGRKSEAAEVLGQLLGMESGEAAVQRAIELADVQSELGDKPAAAEALERGLAAEPQNAELRRRLRALYEALEQWEKLSALAAQEADFAATPDEAVKLLRQAAGILSSKRGDHAGAAELLDRASQLKPDDRDLMLELCDRYSSSGRGKAAAQVLEKIVASYGPKRTRELGEIHRRLANAYLAEGETQKALEELDKAFRIEPGNVGVLTQLGEVAMKVADYKKAQQMYRALLLQKLDDGGPIKKSFVFMRLGEIHEALGEKPKAMQMYERAIQTDGLAEAKLKLDALK
ncbi:MAG TPA: tetratricopeptide repeat protein [Polyangiaceae bacterium]|nr:tetratricopeptide repeat protein [Polyangiaceae bacterium]